MPDVVDNPAQSRLEIVEETGIAVLEYRRLGTELALIHTGVPTQFEGRGYGAALVQAAIQLARDENLSIAPYCPYARAWIEKHPDAIQGVTIDPID
jgi:predicted GNAT family acetyltransferase